MTPPAGASRFSGSTLRDRAWLVVGLLFLIQLVNFADKSVVSLAAPAIMKEFALTPERYGVLAAAFFSLYAVAGIGVAVFAAPRYRPRRIMAVLLLIWSVVQLPIVFAASFPILVACRMLLGMGEGAGTPTALNAAHEWFDNDERNMPSAIILFGSTAGSMVAAPLLTAIMEAFGWRSAFAACALLGLAVLLLWLVLARDGPHVAIESPVARNPMPPAPKRHAPSWRVPSLWGVGLVGACAYWLTGFMVGWLAPLVRTMVADPGRAAWTLSAIFAVQAVCVLAISLASQMLLRWGWRSRLARGAVVSLCMGGAGLAFLLIPYAHATALKLALLAVAMSLPAPVFPICSALVSEVTPSIRRNQAMTLIMSVITLAAIPSSYVTGLLVGAPHMGWNAVLIVNGAIALVGGFACLLLVDPGRDAPRTGFGVPV